MPAAIHQGAFTALLIACNVGGVPPVDPALANAPTPQQVTEAMGESSRRVDADGSVAVFGWHVEVSGARVRWRECTSLTVCGFEEREIDALNLLRMKKAGETSVVAPDGPRTVEVQELTLRSRSAVKP
jgi:hypothetical protein